MAASSSLHRRSAGLPWPVKRHQKSRGRGSPQQPGANIVEAGNACPHGPTHHMPAACSSVAAAWATAP
eukprot:4281698-Lingulodinium_polyedra.AAC.1